jgi:hypothetical protein
MCDQPDDGDSKYFWNVGKRLPDDMALEHKDRNPHTGRRVNLVS